MQVVLAAGVLDNSFVDLVARGADGVVDDDAAQRDNSDFCSAAADVDYHRADGLLHGETRADCGGHRLLDRVSFASARVDGGVVSGAALDLGHARRDADNDPWLRS